MKKLYKIIVPLLILGMIFVLLPSTANAAATRVQATNGKNTTFASSVASTAFASPLTNPSLIVVCWEGDGVAVANSGNTPTDTAGNTYVKVKDQLNSGVFDVTMWYALNTHTTASDVITVTDTGGGIDSTMSAEEWSGMATAAPTDGTAAAANGISTALNSGNTTTSVANDMIINCAAAAISGNHLSLANSFTNLNQTSTTFSNIGDSTQIQSVAGAIAGTMTVSSSVSWTDIVSGFKAAATAGTTNHGVTYITKATGYMQKSTVYIK